MMRRTRKSPQKSSQKKGSDSKSPPKAMKDPPRPSSPEKSTKKKGLASTSPPKAVRDKPSASPQASPQRQSQRVKGVAPDHDSKELEKQTKLKTTSKAGKAVKPTDAGTNPAQAATVLQPNDKTTIHEAIEEEEMEEATKATLADDSATKTPPESVPPPTAKLSETAESEGDVVPPEASRPVTQTENTDSNPFLPKVPLGLTLETWRGLLGPEVLSTRLFFIAQEHLPETQWCSISTPLKKEYPKSFMEGFSSKTDRSGATQSGINKWLVTESLSTCARHWFPGIENTLLQAIVWFCNNASAPVEPQEPVPTLDFVSMFPLDKIYLIIRRGNVRLGVQRMKLLAEAELPKTKTKTVKAVYRQILKLGQSRRARLCITAEFRRVSGIP
jgi:hypothetical protein